MAAAEIFAFAEMSFGITGPIWFLADHWIQRTWLKRHKLPEILEVPTGELPRISILLCVRNEAQIIEGKLTDLARQDYPRELLEVLLIDTGSTDETVQLAEDWAARALDFGPLVRFLSTTGVEGKSAAVNLGISEAEADFDVILMTDADARLPPGALRRVASWMVNPEVGAVCGRQVALPANTDDNAENSSGNSDVGRLSGGEFGAGEVELESYRGYYNMAREAESRYHSTPIFEGSLAAYRRSAIKNIVSTSNADDSQLAVQVTLNGLRAIHDPDLHFLEAVPLPGRGFHRQRLRRAQGVVRHLWRNSSLWFSGTRNGQIHRMNAHAHLLLPWMILGWAVATLGFQIAYWLNGSSEPILTLLWWANFPLVGAVILGGRRMRSFLHGMYCLALSQVLTLVGISFHRWEPEESSRQRIADFDADYEWPIS
jgi:cellulose synthase/poly-beta-1,6-N-acetylglucosamine synthase-like glycosyltransferase